MKEEKEVHIAQHLDENFNVCLELVWETDLQLDKQRKCKAEHGLDRPRDHQVFVCADYLVAVPAKRVSEQ